MADKSGRRLLLIVSLNFSIMFNIMWLFAWRMRNRMTKSSIALQVSASGMAFSLLVVAISFYVKVIIYWYVLFCCYIHIIHCFIISMYVSAHVCGYHSLSEQFTTFFYVFFSSEIWSQASISETSSLYGILSTLSLVGVVVCKSM